MNADETRLNAISDRKARINLHSSCHHSKKADLRKTPADTNALEGGNLPLPQLRQQTRAQAHAFSLFILL